MDYQFCQIYDYVTIESNVLHQLESYLQLSSCMNILCSLHRKGGLKIDIEIGISIQYFRLRLQQISLHPLHCDVECFDFDRRKSQKMLPVNVPRSEILQIPLKVLSN